MLDNLLNKFKFFGKNSHNGNLSSTLQDSVNWYEERYEKITVQRNLLLTFIFILLILIVVAIISIVQIANFRKFDPYVIQIDNQTGLAEVVKPLQTQTLSSDESIAKYFIKKYVIARETYNPVDFDTLAKKTIRLMSTDSIYNNYISYIRNKLYDPTIIYNQKNTTFLIVKSWSKVDAKKYLFRFSINETSQSKKIYNKIALVEFDYITSVMTDDEKDINPIGFKVTGYRVDDDNS